MTDKLAGHTGRRARRVPSGVQQSSVTAALQESVTVSGGSPIRPGPLQRIGHLAVRHWLIVPLLVIGVVFAAGTVMTHDVFLAASDLRAVQQMSRLHVDPLDAVALAIHTGLDGMSAWFFLALVSVAVWAIRRSWTAALFVVMLTVGGWALTSMMKGAVGRQRPDPAVLADPLVPSLTGFTSYPSGHTAFAVSLAIAVSVVMFRTRWSTITIVGAGLFGVIVGLSRVYLGVHYVSDIVASVALSIAAALLLTGLTNGLTKLMGSWREAHRRNSRDRRWGTPAAIPSRGGSLG